MARGWESKSIEAQQDEAEKAREARRGPAPTPEEIARREKKEGLLLSRARTQAALQTACHPGHRALLERTLAHIDAELKEL
jgi:hypothetical protein